MIVLPDPMLLSSAHATVAQANRAFTVILINRQSSRIPSRDRDTVAVGDFASESHLAETLAWRSSFPSGKVGLCSLHR
jgi:hypothetical protein